MQSGSGSCVGKKVVTQPLPRLRLHHCPLTPPFTYKHSPPAFGVTFNAKNQEPPSEQRWGFKEHARGLKNIPEEVDWHTPRAMKVMLLS